MADAAVKTSKGGNWWMWLLGIALLGGIAYGVYYLMNKDKAEETPATT